ncbi:MAG: hypothetical protein EA403_05895 [Spirochaetaceae bacterium]|nr:MAG: hypothetical protein EA403_05895 [Spirochaetaceae bacterium]
MLLVAVLALLLGACGRGETPAVVELPPTPVVSARLEWAVVRSVYVQILSEPSAGAEIEGHVRRGAVLRVHSRTPFTATVDGVRNHWYSVSTAEFSGWVFGAVIDTYATEAVARSASEAMRLP